MILITSKVLPLRDGNKNGEPAHQNLQPGKHRVERIDSPLDNSHPWLVIPDTNIGLAECWLREQDGITIQE